MSAPRVGTIWVQRRKLRRVSIVGIRSQGPHGKPIVQYRFLDNGARWNRVLPEFSRDFDRERGALSGLEPWVRVKLATSLSEADRERLGR